MTHSSALTIPFLLAGVLLAASDVPAGMNRFAAAAYRQLAAKDGNLILSPFSISTALSMLLEGARGQTAAGMTKALDQPGTGPGYHEAVAALAGQLGKQANLDGNQLAIANALWLQKGFPLQAAFEQAVHTLYQAPTTQLDFRGGTEQARQEINRWTAQQTHDKIQELFAPGSIDGSVRLVLTSAIYFYGKWQSPFDPQQTRAEAFQPGTGAAAPAPFMHQKTNFLYGETPAAQILEMKYQGTGLAFDIILPKATDGLAELERSLNAETLAAWFGALRSWKVDAAIPKFRAESAFSLREVLSRMGMAEAFGRAADFSGIDGRHDLAVGDVMHKAFVDVSEEGTEAAAATGVTVHALAMRRQQETVFRADHPFAFFIRDTASGVILFEGRLLKP
jgi:serpin B